MACRTRNEADRYGAAQRAVANGAVAVCVEKNCAETRRAGTSCAETVPNRDHEHGLVYHAICLFTPPAFARYSF